MNRLLLLLSNTLLVLLEVIVLTFFASIFFKKNLSTVKFLISIILLAAFNVTALALLDKYFWLKAFVLTIVDAIWLKISYIDSLLRFPFSLDGIDLTYLFMICEQTFNIRFTEQDSNNYGLLTPKNWIDVIESHL